jgi:hypothetical protein
MRHFPSNDVCVVDDDHLFGGVDGAKGRLLTGLVRLLDLIRVEVVVP